VACATPARCRPACRSPTREGDASAEERHLSALAPHVRVSCSHNDHGAICEPRVQVLAQSSRSVNGVASDMTAAWHEGYFVTHREEFVHCRVFVTGTEGVRGELHASNLLRRGAPAFPPFMDVTPIACEECKRRRVERAHTTALSTEPGRISGTVCQRRNCHSHSSTPLLPR
jgi:hypothetical protein